MKRYSIYLLFHFFVFFILYHTIGIYAEELAEMANSAAHNGLFVQKPICLFNNSNNFTIITFFIVTVKEIFPGYNIHGLLMLFMSCVFMTNYFMIVHKICLENKILKSNVYLEKIYFVLLYALLIDTILFTQYTRVSFHLITSGIVLFNLTDSKWLKSTAIFSVLIGMMIRFDTFFVVAPFCLLFYLLLIKPVFSFSVFWQPLKKNVLFIIFILFFVVISDINFTKADKNYEPYRSVIYSFECFQAKGSDFKLKNELDSLKYKMVENHFYNEISINEMYKIGIKPMDRDPFNTFKYFSNFRIQKGWNDFILFMKYNHRSLIVYLICIILLISFIHFKNAYKIFAIYGISVLLLLMISIYIKLEDRVAFPILNLSVLLTFFYVIYSVDNYKKTLLPVSVLIVIFLFGNNIDREKINDRIHIEHLIDKTEKYLSANKTVKKIYWDFVLNYLLLNKEASGAKLYNEHRDFMIDNSLFYITDEYRNRMLFYFNSYKFIDVVKISINNPENVFFTTPDKMEFYLKTLKLKYNLHLKAEKVDNDYVQLFTGPDSTSKFFLYRLTY